MTILILLSAFGMQYYADSLKFTEITQQIIKNQQKIISQQNEIAFLRSNVNLQNEVISRIQNEMYFYFFSSATAIIILFIIIFLLNLFLLYKLYLIQKS